MKKTTKITISIDEQLLEQLDNYADDNGYTRSGLIGNACRQFLIASKAQPSLLQLLKKLGDLAGKGAGLSDEERSEMLNSIEKDQTTILGMFER